MRKAVMIGLVVAIAVVITGTVYAWWPGGGCGVGYRTATDIENVKKFQKETLGLRDELITKRLELRNEYSKPAPDTNRIGALRKEIIDLQTAIHAVADKYELPTGGMMGGRMACGTMGRGMKRSGAGMMCSGWQ